MGRKLSIDDVIEVTEEYFGLKEGQYRIIGFDENRLGADMYKVVSNRRNAVTEHYLYVKDVDADLKEVTEEFENGYGAAFIKMGARIVTSKKFKCNK